MTWDFKDFPALKFEMCNFRVLSKTWILCKSGKRKAEIGSMKQYLILVLFEIFDRMFQFQMGSDSSGVCFKILPHWNWSSHSLSELQIPYFGGEYGSRNERFKVSRLAIGSSRWLVRLYWFSQKNLMEVFAFTGWPDFKWYYVTLVVLNNTELN